ncbi:S-adenosyl-L-methionine-dependent methyltransferase superfamily protein [Forsythia ovata]|uniref:S-adenosyl-L-methionine-dependent methyltransferase superfamily protein n=1 Tax=Forsythia ovata TaxID=205694 RepID=A0ABD1T484_9LAMI
MWHGKKQSHRQGRRAAYNLEEEEEIQDYPLSPQTSSAQEPILSDSDKESQEVEIQEKETDIDKNPPINNDVPSKFLLYQQSVQSPKGDISYLQKFFLMYVGGRLPLHLQEDFCGTALLSVEWLHSDARRTAVGLDLDAEALDWCMENNMNKIGADVYSRISLFHGNVLQPLKSRLVNLDPHEIFENITLDHEGNSKTLSLNSTTQGSPRAVCKTKLMEDTKFSARDIVCAFNYSCCCLHSRKELVLYFKHARNALSTKGGIFVMDLYGGTSSECELRMQRRFPNFKYTWEQAGFDIIQRKTRISLHFNLHKQHKKIRHAFSYSWRLWSLPEIKESLEEAGFRSVHFWIRNMPDSEEIKCMDGFPVGRDLKYEESLPDAGRYVQKARVDCWQHVVDVHGRNGICW